MWTPDPETGVKRFDEAYLRNWCQHFGFDFERYSRVDHDRGDESRTQYQCVFSYQKNNSESIEIDGERWSIGTEKMPRTFVEIDEEGLLRVQGWSTERILDVEALWHDGTKLMIEAANNESPLRIDAADLTP
ncbi:MAG: hypothetical protein ABEI77_05680 [Halorientalis sp.]